MAAAAAAAAAVPRTKTLVRTLACRNCNSEDIRKDDAAGDWICMACGTVAEAVIDEHSEWRSFSDSTEDVSRVGGPTSDLAVGVDSFAAVISGTNPLARELGRANARVSRTAHQRNLLSAFQLISTFCDRLHVAGSIANTAKRLYKEHEQNLRGRGEKAVVGACILIACRLEKSTRSYREIIPVVDVPKRELSQCVTKLKLAMKEPVSFTRAEDLVVRRARPQERQGMAAELLAEGSRAVGDPGGCRVNAKSVLQQPALCNKLRLPQSVLNLAVMVARKVFELGIAMKCVEAAVAPGRAAASIEAHGRTAACGAARLPRTLARHLSRSPATVAATIICMVNLISAAPRLVSGRMAASADVSREAQVAESTIRLTYRTDLYARREELFPPQDRFPPSFSLGRSVAELNVNDL